MLLSLTPNPALDRVLTISDLHSGGVHRASAVRLFAGGKGLNVARASRTLDLPAIASGPLAGHTGRLLAELAQREGLAGRWFWRRTGETRHCHLMVHDREDATVVNEPGQAWEPEEWRRWLQELELLFQEPDVRGIAISGSFPAGSQPAALWDLARRQAAAGTLVVLDSSGVPLSAALEQPEHLVIKVNAQELGQALSRQPKSLGDLLEVGQRLLDRGLRSLVITLGRLGALSLCGDGAFFAEAPHVRAISSVGSGDSFLAGWLASRLAGEPVDKALRSGVAAGSANALSADPGCFSRESFEELSKQVRPVFLG